MLRHTGEHQPIQENVSAMPARPLSPRPARACLSLLACAAALACTPALAAPADIDLPAQPLSHAIKALARATGTSIAADSALLAEPMQRFTTMLIAALGTLAAGLVLAVVLQLRLALRPLQLLRKGLSDVRKGATPRLEGRFPQELRPLVQEFNHVLDVNADMVQRARTQAGNLAHAVNTPLSILGNAAAQEGGALAELVREQVASASRQVDHHLARARAAARQATGLRTPLEPPLASLVRTMERLHAGRGIRFALKGDAQPWDFLGDGQDLMEILGNLLDNAGKWARSRVTLAVCQDGTTTLLQIDDDGPGLAPEHLAQAMERGVRFDEQAQGHGLGLAIVRDIAETYGGSLEMGPSPLGGLRCTLRLG